MTVHGIDGDDIKRLMEAAEQAINHFSEVSVPWIREKENDDPVQLWLRQMTARAIIMAYVSHGTALKTLDPGSMIQLNGMIAQYLDHLDERSSKIETAEIISNMMKPDA